MWTGWRTILPILALNAHHDKRPMNALLAKAMEVCVQKGVGWFVYGNYIYGNKKDEFAGGIQAAQRF